MRAIRDAVGRAGELIPEPATISREQVNRQNAYLEHYTANAMACEFAIMFNMHQYPQSGSVTAKVFESIASLERQLTIYDDESEVSEVNRVAARKQMTVENGLFELLVLASRLHRATEGAFDITSSPLSRVWGFHQREGRLPSEDEIQGALELVGAHQILLEEENHSVRFENEGISINLGGIGKGYALDQVTEWVTAQGINDFLIHGGQSSVVARGAQQADVGSDDQMGWTVGLSHPLAPDRRLCEFQLSNEALGTSGTGRQGFFVKEKDTVTSSILGLVGQQIIFYRPR